MRVLIVGELQGQLGVATRMAMARGAKVSHTNDADHALVSLRRGIGADLVLADLSVGIGSLIHRLESERIHVPVVACGGSGCTRQAVEAIQEGAREFLPLPPDAELIAAILEAVSNDESEFVFQDSSMADQASLARKIAPSDANVLITGESGTGKEVMARYVHNASRRSRQSFVSINCAAIPDNLLESELFGHEKGAFTGAVARRIGKFEEASGGTLLLDEISEMDPRLQAKLLRATQEKIIDRIGGSKPIKVDIRIIATSNRDLVEAVREGSFREDLLYRLNVVNLKLPPLRERMEDLRILAEHFAKKYAELNHLPIRPITSSAYRTLASYNWPGNVRELESAMHRAVLLSSGSEIDDQALMRPDGTSYCDASTPPEVSDAARVRGAIVGRTVAEVERDLIIDTIDHCLGNRTHAAKILGISIRTLRNKLRTYVETGVIVPAVRGDVA